MFVDTSFCIDLMREHSRGMTDGPALSKLRELGNIPLYMSLFVACELHAGARLSARPSLEIRKVERLTDRVEMVSPGNTFPVAYGEAVRHRLSGGVLPWCLRHGGHVRVLGHRYSHLLLGCVRRLLPLGSLPAAPDQSHRHADDRHAARLCRFAHTQ